MSEYLQHPSFDSPLVAEDNKTLLDGFSEQALEDYRSKKEDLLLWLLTKGKDPFSEDGYAPETVRKSHYKIERTYRWMWKTGDRYRWRFQPKEADQFCDYLWKYDNIPQPQIAEYEKAIRLLFKYWNNTTTTDIEWRYDRNLTKSYNSERDHFEKHELRMLYEASLTYQPFSTDSGWKIPSLIGVTNDLGLRPKEVQLAKTTWMYPEDQVVKIPKEDSVKSSSSWTCGLSEQTALALARWLEQRETYTAYDDTKLVWLNEHGNPYDHRSVNYLLDKLLEKTNIESFRRNLTWYSIRHGVATMWADQENLNKAKDQLRHEKAKTTINYTHTSKGKQSDAADGKW